jgi:hypothetical protein
VTYKSTDDAAKAILKILEDQEQELSAVLKIERQVKKNRTNEIMVSLKKGGQTFRITFNWVPDEYASYHGFLLGNGYIEHEWDLALRPEKKEFPVAPPFLWELHSHDQTIEKAAYPAMLTEDWLRRLIRRKLAIPQ